MTITYISIFIAIVFFIGLSISFVSIIKKYKAIKTQNEDFINKMQTSTYCQNLNLQKSVETLQFCTFGILVVSSLSCACIEPITFIDYITLTFAMIFIIITSFMLFFFLKSYKQYNISYNKYINDTYTAEQFVYFKDKIERYSQCMTFILIINIILMIVNLT